MKRCIALLFSTLLGLISPAFATNYPTVQCSSSSICFLSSSKLTALSGSDTESFVLNDVVEADGVHPYESTSGITIKGGRACVGGKTQNCVEVIVDNATVDGIRLVPPTSGYAWVLGINLPKGQHIVAVVWHATGLSISSDFRWSGDVFGITYGTPDE